MGSVSRLIIDQGWCSSTNAFNVLKHVVFRKGPFGGANDEEAFLKKLETALNGPTATQDPRALRGRRFTMTTVADVKQIMGDVGTFGTLTYTHTHV